MHPSAEAAQEFGRRLALTHDSGADEPLAPMAELATAALDAETRMLIDAVITCCVGGDFDDGDEPARLPAPDRCRSAWSFDQLNIGQRRHIVAVTPVSAGHAAAAGLRWRAVAIADSIFFGSTPTAAVMRQQCGDHSGESQRRYQDRCD